MNTHTCRVCFTPLEHTFVDLGTAPLCQKHVTPARYNEAEKIYPQHVYVCEKCFLVQLPAYVEPEDIFDSEYGYFSGFSKAWLEHCKEYVEMMTSRFNLGKSSKVLEIASNDGSLLQYFQAKGIPCMGVEPTENTAMVARERDIPTVGVFFTRENADILLSAYGPQDIILGNNVLAHVPDINDFVSGMKRLLAPGGVITMEFPALHNLIKHGLWDTIYHEHFSYLSFTTVRNIFADYGLTIFDVEVLPTHGGSLRIFARHNNIMGELRPAVHEMLQYERLLGHGQLDYYTDFARRVCQSKRDILEWFTYTKNCDKTIAGFGAPGKGNTLLNYCGIRTDFMDFVVDDSPHKQGNFLPGSRIPILHPGELAARRPDYIVIMPWNWQEELAAKLAYTAAWGAKLVVLLPEVKVL
jgi:SAM-dependent methyltransferase